jgi:hypothetical protein
MVSRFRAILFGITRQPGISCVHERSDAVTVLSALRRAFDTVRLSRFRHFALLPATAFTVLLPPRRPMLSPPFFIATSCQWYVDKDIAE